MAQTFTFSKLLLREHRMKLLMLLIMCCANVQLSSAQSLPFSYDGPWASPANSNILTNGLSNDVGNNLGTSTTGGSANFKSQGAFVQVQVASGVKIISYAVRAGGVNKTFTGTFVVAVSTDNAANFSPVRIIDARDNLISSAGSEKIITTNLASNVTHVRFTYSSHVAGQSILLDAIRVTPPKPEINVKQTSDIASGGRYEFGTTNLNSSNVKTFTIENLGIGPLTLTGQPKIAITGANANNFIIDESATLSTIPDVESGEGNQTTFQVTFRPTTFGSKTATLSISNDDSDENPYLITIAGNGDVFAPVITEMSPIEGPVGTKIIMKGDYFANVSRVTFTGGAVAAFRILNDNEIEVTVPAGASSGPIRLEVTGGKFASSPIFTVLYDAPIITSVTPLEGYIGETIVIRGTNFNEIRSVKFNGVNAGYTRVNSTEIRAIVPEGATSGYITIETAAGLATSEETFIVLYTGPVISGFDIEEGYVGDVVTIIGENLTGVVGVWFNGVVVEEFEEVSATELIVVVPAGATTGLVTVQTTAGTATSPMEFTVLTLSPIILTVEPNQGYVGDIIVITGENFFNPISIFFNGVEAPGYILDSNNQIRVQIPEGATTGLITIITPQGTGESETDFIVLEPSILPEILVLDPYQGYVGDVVTIIGENLTGVVGVWFNGVEVEEFEEVSATELIVVVPAGATTGLVTVQTTAGTASSSEPFTVLKQLPSIVSFDPTQGRVGTIVTITGLNFEDVEDVLFNGVSTGFIAISNKAISAQVPAGATTGPITVRTANGSATSDDVFTVLPSPTIIISQNEMALTTAVGTNIAGMYTVEASNLLDGENVIVNVSGLPGDYTISRTGEEGTFVKSITFEPGTDIFDNTLETKELYVRFAPTASGASSAQITHSSEGAQTEILTVNGSTPTIPLPVELIAFKASKQTSGVLLTWATASELDNDFFEVQVSDRANGDFKAIGQVKSRVNTTTIRQDYQFEHKGGFVGTRYYRLKQVDLDGTTDFSKVVAVTSNDAALVAGARVYPNPVNPTSKLEFTAPEAGKLNVTIVNMSGSRIQSMSYDVEAGKTTLELNLSNSLPAGMYILTTEFNGRTEQVKLMKN